MIDLSFDVGIIFVISWYHSLNIFFYFGENATPALPYNTKLNKLLKWVRERQIKLDSQQST